MYETGQNVKNIKLDDTKEEREQQIAERKKNRHKHRNDFSAMQRFYRLGINPPTRTAFYIGREKANRSVSDFSI